jgi:hypothetical protein
MQKKNYDARVTKLERFFGRLQRSPTLQAQGQVSALARGLVKAVHGRNREEIDLALGSLNRAVGAYQALLTDRR